MQFGSDKPDEFTTGLIALKLAPEGRCCCHRILFLYAPHHHAQMGCFNDNGNSHGIQGILDSMKNLGGETLLHLQPSGKNVYYPSKLTQTSNPSIGYIGDMGFAIKRKHMMF